MNNSDKTGYIYLLASKEGGTLYLGVTSDLVKRIAEHKAGTFKGFSYKHGVHTLVYYEECGSIEAAIIREKKIEKMAARMENRADRKNESRLARFISAFGSIV